MSDSILYFARTRDVCTSTAERPERLADPSADATTAERPRPIILDP